MNTQRVDLEIYYIKTKKNHFLGIIINVYQVPTNSYLSYKLY